jgi:hypothetical protein
MPIKMRWKKVTKTNTIERSREPFDCCLHTATAAAVCMLLAADSLLA